MLTSVKTVRDNSTFITQGKEDFQREITPREIHSDKCVYTTVCNHIESVISPFILIMLGCAMLMEYDGAEK